MRFFTRLMDTIERVFSGFLVVVLGIMTTALFTAVMSRYFLRISFPWADPIARYGQTWIMLLGAAVVLRRGMHIGFDVLVNKLPERLRQWILKLNLLLILVFSVTMTVQGLELIRRARYQVIPEFGLPFVYVYYMFPVAGIYLVLTSVELLLRPRIEGLTSSE